MTKSAGFSPKIAGFASNILISGVWNRCKKGRLKVERIAKRTIEDCATLDIRDLVREGHLRDGNTGEICLPQGDEGKIVLSFTVKDDWFDFDITDATSLDAYPRNSVVLSCPVNSPEAKNLSFFCPLCNATVRTIHLPPGAGHFACRTCHGLSYRSRQGRLPEWEKLEARLARVEKIIDGARPGCPRWLAALEEEKKLLARRQEILLVILRELERLKQRDRAMRREDRRQARERRKLSHLALPEAAARSTEEVSLDLKRPRGRPRKEKRPYHREKPFPSAERESPAQGFCFGCRGWHEPVGERLVTYSSGRTAVWGTCPNCKATITRIIKQT